MLELVQAILNHLFFSPPPLICHNRMMYDADELSDSFLQWLCMLLSLSLYVSAGILGFRAA